jgi:O-acetyl-ADP-ribose deacetylase (regulator of RNase III)
MRMRQLEITAIEADITALSVGVIVNAAVAAFAAASSSVASIIFVCFSAHDLSIYRQLLGRQA